MGNSVIRGLKKCNIGKDLAIYRFKHRKDLRADNDEYHHCMASCQTSRRNDPQLTIEFGIEWEIVYTPYALVRKRVDPWEHLKDSCGDILANMRGVGCPTSLSCEACCCGLKQERK